MKINRKVFEAVTYYSKTYPFRARDPETGNPDIDPKDKVIEKMNKFLNDGKRQPVSVIEKSGTESDPVGVKGYIMKGFEVTLWYTE